MVMLIIGQLKRDVPKFKFVRIGGKIFNIVLCFLAFLNTFIDDLDLGYSFVDVAAVVEEAVADVPAL